MKRDYPVVMGTLYVFTLMGLLEKLVSDISYSWVDPRIHFGGQKLGRLKKCFRIMTDKPFQTMKTHTSNPTWQAFKQHKRGWFALRVLAVLFAVALLAPLWSNDKPLWIRYQGEYYFPLVNEYNENCVRRRFSIRLPITSTR